MIMHATTKLPRRSSAVVKTIDQLAADPEVQKELAKRRAAPSAQVAQPPPHKKKERKPETIEFLQKEVADLERRADELEELAKLRRELHKRRTDALSRIQRLTTDDGGLRGSLRDEMERITLPFLDGSVTLDDLRSPSRPAYLCAVRFKIYDALLSAGYSATDIGRYLHRTHGAILEQKKRNERRS